MYAHIHPESPRRGPASEGQEGGTVNLNRNDTAPATWRHPQGRASEHRDRARLSAKEEQTMRKLEHSVAMVTGASKGIGAAIAKQLAADGAAVVVNYAVSKDGADRVVAEIIGNGGRAIAVQADVSKPTEVRRLFAEAKKAFGRLDIL